MARPPTDAGTYPGGLELASTWDGATAVVRRPLQREREQRHGWLHRAHEVALAAARDMWRSVHAQGGWWTWADESGVTPWSDSHGHDVIPLWTSAQRATEESRGSAEEGVGPAFLGTEKLLALVPRLLEAGVTEAGLHGEGGRFLLTVELASLEEELACHRPG